MCTCISPTQQSVRDAMTLKFMSLYPAGVGFVMRSLSPTTSDMDVSRRTTSLTFVRDKLRVTSERSIEKVCKCAHWYICNLSTYSLMMMPSVHAPWHGPTDEKVSTTMVARTWSHAWVDNNTCNLLICQIWCDMGRALLFYLPKYIIDLSTLLHPLHI